MRKIAILLTILVIMPFFSIKSFATDKVDEFISEFDSVLPDGFDGLSDSEKLMEMASIRGLLLHIISSLSGDRGVIYSFLLTLLGSAALICAAALCHDRMSNIAQCVVGIICSVSIFSFVMPLIGSVEEGIKKISDFFASLIPITLGITALGGGTATASAQAVGMYTALSSVGGVGSRIFLMISSFGLAMSLLSAFGNEGIGSVCRGLKGLFGWISGIFTALITAAFSLQTLIASSVDSASMRAIRYAASGLIPVVGSTVSGAISTLASGLSYAKGIIGGGAIIVILYMAISPLVLMLLYRLGLTLAMIFTDFSGAAVASRIFGSYRFAIDMTITVYALSTLIYLFEIIIFIMIGVAAL